MITNSALHGRHDILTVISSEERQHPLCLTLAGTLLLQEAFQEVTCHVPEFGKTLTKLHKLFSMIRGRTMYRINPMFSGETLKEQVPGDLPNLTVVNQEFGFRDTHGKQFSYQPPRD